MAVEGKLAAFPSFVLYAARSRAVVGKYISGALNELADVMDVF